MFASAHYKGTSTFASAEELAKRGKGEDKRSYRAELIKLIETAKLLSQ